MNTMLISQIIASVCVLVLIWCELEIYLAGRWLTAGGDI